MIWNIVDLLAKIHGRTPLKKMSEVLSEEYLYVMIMGECGIKAESR